MFSQYFSLLLGTVDRNYGDVIKFCGDAVIVMWPIDADADDNMKRAAIKMSIVCALDLLASCGTYEKKMNSSSVTVSLRLHCGISCGSIHCMCLGDEDRWEFLISGPALKEVGAAEAEAKLGEVCITGPSYRRVENIFEAELKSNDVYRLTGQLVGMATNHVRGGVTGGVFLQRSMSDDTHATGSVESGTYLGNVDINATSDDENSFANSTGSKSSKGSHVVHGTAATGRRGNRVMTAISRVASVMKLVQSSPVEEPTPFGQMEEQSSELSVRSSRLSIRMKGSTDHEEANKQQTILDPVSQVEFVRSSLNLNMDEYIANAINFVGDRHFIDSILCERSGDMASKMRLFVPMAARVAIENKIMSYLAELRVVVTLFMEVLGLDDDFDQGLSDRPSKVISIVLASLKKYEGSLRQYVVDDKGCVIIAAFGLPGSAHEDNSVRAIETAVRIRHLLNEESINCRFGITQGRVYCGLVGCGERCEYAMMGASVNLAARFMSQARYNEIVVAENLYQDCQNDFLFHTLDKVKAKGYTKPVAAFTPTERLRQGTFLSSSDFRNKESQETLVERKTEMSMLTFALDKFVATGGRNMFIVDGPVGIGKTWLFSKFHEYVTKSCSGIKKAVMITASTHHTNSRYFYLRQIIDQVLNIANVKQDRIRGNQFHDNVAPSSSYSSAGKQLLSASLSLVGAVATQECIEITTRALTAWMIANAADITVKDLDVEPDVYSNEVASHNGNRQHSDEVLYSTDTNAGLSGDTTLIELIPLLTTILPIEVEQTDLCQMIGHWARAKLCIAIIVKILKMTALSRDNVFLVENLQWIDIPTLEILCKLVTSSDTGFFVGTIRTQRSNDFSKKGSTNTTEIVYEFAECSSTTQKFVAQMLQACVSCTLQPLTSEDIRMILESSIPERFLRARPEILRPNSISQVVLRTDGKPYLTSAFILTLRDSLVNGKYNGLEHLPSGEQNIIVHRFDKLDSKQQTLLKLASVVGDTFSYDFLVKVLREMRMKENLTGLRLTLSRLVHSTLIIAAPSTSHDDDDYDFDYGKTAPNEFYKFTTKTIRYSIYNLMLTTQKESTHDVVGKLLEKAHSKFDTVAKHFFRSNNVPKKLTYLQESIYRAYMDNDLYVMKSLLKNLLTLATGMDVNELLAFCCRQKVNLERPAVEKKSQLGSLRGRKVDRNEVALGSQWVQTHKFHHKFAVIELKTLEDDSAVDTTDSFMTRTNRMNSAVSLGPMSRRMDSNDDIDDQPWFTSPIKAIGREMVCLWIAQLGGVEFRYSCTGLYYF
jgi:class 3 adenylate cyclase